VLFFFVSLLNFTLISKRVTEEGEIMPYLQTELSVVAFLKSQTNLTNKLNKSSTGWNRLSRRGG
jgi:hypothetical protein